MGFISNIRLALRVEQILKAEDLQNDKRAHKYIFGLEGVLIFFRKEKLSPPFLMERVFFIYSLSVDLIQGNQSLSNEIYLRCLNKWYHYYQCLAEDGSGVLADDIDSVYLHRHIQFQSYNCFFVFENQALNDKNCELLNIYWNRSPLTTIADKDVDLRIYQQGGIKDFIKSGSAMKLSLIIKNVFPPVKEALLHILLEANKG